MSENALNVFISYAHEDEKYLNDFKVHSKSLVREGLINEWTDREIEAGEEWDEEIKSNLHNADIIIFLVSPPFIGSDYIHNVEIKKALENYEKGKSVLVPIIIRTSDFSALPIQKFQALPRNAKPISTWDDKDAAWLDVTKQLRKLIKSKLGGSKKSINKAVNSHQSSDNDRSQNEDNSNSCAALRQQVLEGDLKAAVKGVLEESKGKGELYNSAILLSSRLNSHIKSKMAGLITPEDGRIFEAQITQSLIYLIDQLERK